MDAARGHVRGAMLGTMTPRMIEESYGLAFPDGSLTAYVEAGIARAEEKYRRARESAETVEHNPDHGRRLGNGMTFAVRTLWISASRASHCSSTPRFSSKYSCRS